MANFEEIHSSLIFKTYLTPLQIILGALAKLREATIRFMSVNPSDQLEQLGFHRTDSHEIWYLRIVLKICRKKISLIKIGQE